MGGKETEREEVDGLGETFDLFSFWWQHPSLSAPAPKTFFSCLSCLCGVVWCDERESVDQT